MSRTQTWMLASLDKRFAQMEPIPSFERPHKGWLAAIREVVGMTAAQLGKRLGVSAAAISQYEKRERDKTIQLQTLEKAAAALGCDLVYVLVPRTSLEDFVDKQAERKAQQYLENVSHTMLLEQQSVEESILHAQKEDFAAKLKSNPKDLWS